MNTRPSEPSVLADLVGAAPDTTAVDDGTRSRTWTELNERTHAIARGLEAIGASAGQHIALICTNRVEFAEAVTGITRGGFSFTPVKTNWAAPEMRYLLEDADSVAVMTDTEQGRDVAGLLGLPVIDIGDGFDDWVGAHLGDPVEPGRRGFRIPYTSGTTGRPKGVHRTAEPPTFEQWVGQGAAFNAALGLPTGGTHLMVSQMFHGAPLNFGMGSMFAGATLRIMDRWDADAALDLLAVANASIMVPTMFRQLLALPEERRAGFDPSHLVRILHGGEACPAGLKRQMIDWWGPLFTEYYGFTEGGMTLATCDEWLAHPGTVGRPMPGMTLYIRDDHGNDLPPGATGTVWFRRDGGRYFSYANADDKTDDAHADDESFTVGDIGRLDADGRLYLSGRTAELIVAAGVNIYPAEIEEPIHTVDGVADACVVGGPDEARGEQPVAFVLLAPGHEAADVEAAISERCRTDLAGYKQPREIRFVDEIPRDPTGKLLRTALRATLWPDST